MNWLDLSKHNAALWVDQEAGRLVLLPINPEEPITGLNPDRWRAWQSTGQLLDADIQQDDQGQLQRLSVRHDPRSANRTRIGDWLQLFPQATLRPTDTMKVGFPPTRSQSESGLAVQWLWQIDGADPDDMQVPRDWLNHTPVRGYTTDEETARRFGNEAVPVRADEPMPHWIGLDHPVTRQGVLWGVPAGTWSQLSTREQAALVVPMPPQARPEANEAERLEAEADALSPNAASDDSAVRDDWGEKIGGARKDDYHTPHGRAIQSIQNLINEATDRRKIDAAPGSITAYLFDVEDSKAVRKEARKIKLKDIWPPTPDAQVLDETPPPLRVLLERHLRAHLPEQVGNLYRATQKNPGSVLFWNLLAQGYTAQVAALRDRVTALTDEQALNEIRRTIEATREQVEILFAKDLTQAHWVYSLKDPAMQDWLDGNSSHDRWDKLNEASKQLDHRNNRLRGELPYGVDHWRNALGEYNARSVYSDGPRRRAIPVTIASYVDKAIMRSLHQGQSATDAEPDSDDSGAMAPDQVVDWLAAKLGERVGKAPLLWADQGLRVASGKEVDLHHLRGLTESLKAITGPVVTEAQQDAQQAHFESEFQKRIDPVRGRPRPSGRRRIARTA